MKICSRFLFFMFLLSCSEDTQETKNPEWDKDKSTEMHKNFAVEEEIDIRLFMERDSIQNYKATGTGLRYKIVEKTENELILPEQTVHLKFKISLLDGTLCYKTEEDEIDEIKVDKSDIESGVQEGLKKLRKGEKARLIVPSHLAHGLVGDMNKIPPLTPIVVDLHVLSVK